MAKAEGKEDTSSVEEKEMSAEQKRSAPRVVHLSRSVDTVHENCSKECTL